MRPVAAEDETQRPELLLDQHLDVVGVQLTVGRRADQPADPVDAALAVDRLEYGVQQRRDVEDLTVGPADELRRRDVAGAGLDTQQLRAGDESRDVPLGRRPGLQLLRARCGSRRAVDGGHGKGSAHHHGWSMVDVWSETAVASPVMLWSMIAVWSATATDSAPGDPMLADTAASIGAAALALAATAPSIGAARLRSPSRMTLTLSRLPSVSEPVVVVAGSTGCVVSPGVAPWVIALSCRPWAVASPVMPWVIAAPWSAWAAETASGESTLALAAASIGAAMLAFAPTARSIGAAASIARSMLALRSSSESTSLSGSAVAPSAASSSREMRDGFVTTPPGVRPLDWPVPVAQRGRNQAQP